MEHCSSVQNEHLTVLLKGKIFKAYGSTCIIQAKLNLRIEGSKEKKKNELFRHLLSGVRILMNFHRSQAQYLLLVLNSKMTLVVIDYSSIPVSSNSKREFKQFIFFKQ